MSTGFTLNDRFISWDSLSAETGKSPQEVATLALIGDWLSGCSSFTAFTSGSTGKPQEILFSRQKAVLSAHRTLDYFNLGAEDHAFVCRDVQKIAGKMMIIRALEAKMNLTVTEPSREPGWDTSDYTFTALAPLMLERLIRQKPLPYTYRCILLGGAPVSRPLSEKIILSGLPVWETFGMTETLSHIAVRKITDPDHTIPFHVIHDLDLKTDQNECLSICGEITDGKWLDTNDRVELLSAKDFRWLGRTDFTINSGGIKIQPEEVEKSIGPILGTMGIHDFFIHGFPHAEYGQAAVLIVQGTAVNDHARVLSQIKSVLPRYKNPLAIAECQEFIHGPTGKLDRFRTAALLAPFAF